MKPCTLLPNKAPTFKPLGNKVHEYERKGETFEIYWADFNISGFIDYHKRMQVFLQFFIDGAVDLEDDDRWECLTIFKKSPTAKNSRYEFVGFSTYYPFFHYPDKIRMRIRFTNITNFSQILILPPFQRAGHGQELYSFMYNRFSTNDKVVDITVEDPNDEFQTLRDRCDLRVLLNANALEAVSAPMVTKDHLKEVMTKFRFCERQVLMVLILGDEID
jgi:histone acetyltransferase 1